LVPGGVLHALNYARLGYPQKKKMALISNATIAILILFLSVSTELPHLFFLVINLAYAGYFYKSQDSLFDRYIKKGGIKGSIVGPVISSILITALIVGFSFGYSYLKAMEYDKAVSLMNDGKYIEAEKMIKLYKKYDPKEESTYYNLSLIYQATNRRDLAISELKDLLKLNPKNSEAQSLMNELTGKESTNRITENGNINKKQ
jgi:tetratricopeptide (TPR) repeat protein